MKRLAGRERRRHFRKTVSVEAKLAVEAKPFVEARLQPEADPRWHRCRILNISPGGAKVAIDLALSRGDPVRLDIPRFGRFGGEVVWRSDGEAGLRFTHDPAEMTEVVMGLAVYG
ncbi:MAG: PilZ domain-containing protein [Elusimicrobia bacterium]|nr:PilZ domain-containing protein [Elusimicrobiota bacterium]